MFRLTLHHHRLCRQKWQCLVLASSRIEHTQTCPGNSKSKDPKGVGTLIRSPPPKVRMAFIPEEWFTFLMPKTGVSGPYVLMFVLTNYLISKEIYVMEHEYYSGLSIFIMVAYAYVKLGPPLAAWLDQEVDAELNAWKKSRQDEIDHYDDVIKVSEDAIMRANAHEILICAKKENVLMQLEASFRERAMTVYNTVKGRLDYQVKLQRAENRVKQKWMIEWILENVRKSITPEFQKQAFDAAITNLDAIASQPKQ